MGWPSDFDCCSSREMILPPGSGVLRILLSAAVALVFAAPVGFTVASRYSAASCGTAAAGPTSTLLLPPPPPPQPAKMAAGTATHAPKRAASERRFTSAAPYSTVTVFARFLG